MCLFIFQKLMNVIDVLIKTMKITVEFNKVKFFEVISNKRNVKRLKETSRLQLNLRKQI